MPATAVSDGRGYVLVTTGGFSVYDAGPGWDRPVPGTVIAVGRESWLIISCNPLYRHCHNEVVDIASGARRELPGPAASFPYDEFSWPPIGVIAPDDAAAAVAEGGPDGSLTVHLISLRSGTNRNLKIVLGKSDGNVLAGTGLSDQSMVWSPDSRWLFVAAADGKLVVVDARTGRAEHGHPTTVTPGRPQSVQVVDRRPQAPGLLGLGDRGVDLLRRRLRCRLGLGLGRGGGAGGAGGEQRDGHRGQGCTGRHDSSENIGVCDGSAPAP